MPRYRLPATVVSLVATAFLGMAPAEAAVAPDYQGSQMLQQELTEPNQSALPDAATGERAANYLDQLAREQRAATGERGATYLDQLAREPAAASTQCAFSNYAGGTSGTSNGACSAAELGEPVGAGGTSGGSMSPFALASKR